MALTECVDCGGKVSTRAEVCIHCGSPVEPPTPQINCPDCGEDFAGSLAACPACGGPAVVPESSEELSEPLEAEPFSSRYETERNALITKEQFEFTKSKYGLQASWAVWADEGDTPKSNMGDLSIFERDETLSKLNPNIVLVALNVSVVGVVLKPFQNFHGKIGGAYTEHVNELREMVG